MNQSTWNGTSESGDWNLIWFCNLGPDERLGNATQKHWKLITEPIVVPSNPCKHAIDCEKTAETWAKYSQVLKSCHEFELTYSFMQNYNLQKTECTKTEKCKPWAKLLLNPVNKTWTAAATCFTCSQFCRVELGWPDCSTAHHIIDACIGWGSVAQPLVHLVLF